MKKDVSPRLLIALCCMVYFTSYMARINYGAVISEVVQSWQISVSQAGFVATLSFLSYGAGQLLAGILGDKFHPRGMITAGLCITLLCNLGVAFSNNIYTVAVVWFINGGAQAMLWPPLVRVMTENLSGENYRRGCTYVSMAASVATIAIYLISPVLIWAGSWKFVFVFSALLCAVTMALWWKKTALLTAGSAKAAPKAAQAPLHLGMLLSALWPILVVIILQGLLRDGITTWMPTFMQQNLNFGTKISILVSAVLPVFAILSVMATKKLYRYCLSETKTSTLLWLAAFVSTIALLFVYTRFAAGAVLCMALITAAMHGINLMLISYYPAKFKHTGNVAFVSGLLNACTYIGSAFSAYAIAALAETFGWNMTIITWAVVCALGLALCLKKAVGQNAGKAFNITQEE